MDSILTSAEIEFFIETMTEQSIINIGNENWMDWHERLHKLNQQAVIEASTMRDEQVKETLISFKKSPVLVHEIILISVWKQKVLPHLLNYVPHPETTFIAYTVLYHEAIALGLLELIMFHGTGSESLGDTSADILEYAYDNAAQMMVMNCDTCSDPQSLTGRKELFKQKQDLNFGIAIKSLSIIRYLAEHLDRVSLSVVSRLYETFDIPMLFAQLLIEKPWVKDGKYFNKGMWIPLRSDALGQVEAQVWLTLRHLLLDQACNTHYHITDNRKRNLVKLLGLMTPILLDQLSPLIELKQFLCQLSVHTPSGNGKSPLLLETVLEVKKKILQQGQGKWKKIAREQVDTIFCTDKEKLRSIAAKLTAAYNTDVIEKFDTKPAGNCVVCGQPSIQRCSKCKEDFYCSRQCQVNDWKNHKEKCLGSSTNNSTK